MDTVSTADFVNFPPKEQQTVSSFVTDGFSSLVPGQARDIVSECTYAHQRAVSPRHIEVLGDLMKRGQWKAKSQIDFGLLHGRLVLVNGYHRLMAQMQSDSTIEWSIAIHPCASEEDLHSLYYSLDSVQRVRGVGDIVRAGEFATRHNLTQKMSEVIYRAVPYIASGFALSPKDRNFMVEKQVDLRLQMAAEYAKAGALFSECLQPLPTTRRTKFLSGAFAAVALITLRYQAAKAHEFWLGVAENSGLTRGDPRQALVNDMLSRKPGGSIVNAFAPPIVAWNAYYAKRELRLVKVVDSFVPVIAGTPFDGRRAK